MPPARIDEMLGLRVLPALLLLSIARCVVPGDFGGSEVASDAQPGEIAFRMAEPNDVAIIVPVTIEGKGPYDFVLDTGATLTCIAESLASELSLEETRGVIGHGASLDASGRMRLVQIESLTLGSTEVNDVTACAIDLSELQMIGLEIDGLLGLNVLENFRVTLDFEREVMRLEPRASS